MHTSRALSLVTPEFAALLKQHGLLHQLIKSIVVEELLETIKTSEDDRQQRLNTFWSQYGITGEDSKQRWLEANKTSEAEIAKKLENAEKTAIYCRQHFGHKAEARFLEKKAELDTVVYSLIRVKDPYQARELYLQIAEGEADFASLASNYSMGPEKDTRGIIGPAPMNRAHPRVVEVLRSSRIGELHPPIHVEGWNIILRLESKNSAELNSNMERQMAQELFEQWLNEETSLLADKILKENS